MSETAIEIIKLCFTTLPFVIVSYGIWQSFSVRAKGYPHTRVIWLLCATIWLVWLLAITGDGVGVGI